MKGPNAEFPPEIQPGTVWVDHQRPNRFLRVEKVQPKDPQKRDIVGLLAVGDSPAEDYSCSIETFQLIWRPANV